MKKNLIKTLNLRRVAAEDTVVFGRRHRCATMTVVSVSIQQETEGDVIATGFMDS
jgi:hypothetical protein